MNLLTLSSSRIVIGSFPGAAFHLPSLENEHVTIECNEKGEHFVINKAQDPFVSLNKLPFGKRPIHSGDQLVVQDVCFKILIEEVDDTEELLKQVEALEDPVIQDTEEQQDRQDPAPPVRIDRINTLDDQSLYPAYPARRSRILPILLLFFCTCILLLSFFWMVNIINKEDETIAAKAVADVGVALLYSSITSSEEIPIERVLARRFTSYGDLSSNEFAQTPYLLDVHFSDDRSRFILIARPRSSFWPAFLLRILAPQKEKQEAIILDSNEMILRQTNALTPFDKFFEKHHSLNRYNTMEMTRLIETTSAVPLGEEFTPLDINGAYRLYNLPRYYLFSETLSKNPTNQFLKLPELAIFSTKGTRDLERSEILMRDHGLYPPLLHIIFNPYKATDFTINIK